MYIMVQFIRDVFRYKRQALIMHICLCLPYTYKQKVTYSWKFNAYLFVCRPLYFK